jgi:hypothetical protein
MGIFPMTGESGILCYFVCDDGPASDLLAWQQGSRDKRPGRTKSLYRKLKLTDRHQTCEYWRRANDGGNFAPIAAVATQYRA